MPARARLACLACHFPVVVGGQCPRCGGPLVDLASAEVRGAIELEVEERLGRMKSREETVLYLVTTPITAVLLVVAWLVIDGFSSTSSASAYSLVYLPLFGGPPLWYLLKRLLTTRFAAMRPGSAVSVFAARRRLAAAEAGQSVDFSSADVTLGVVENAIDPARLDVDAQLVWLAGQSTLAGPLPSPPVGAPPAPAAPPRDAAAREALTSSAGTARPAAPLRHTAARPLGKSLPPVPLWRRVLLGTFAVAVLLAAGVQLVTERGLMAVVGTAVTDFFHGAYLDYLTWLFTLALHALVVWGVARLLGVTFTRWVVDARGAVEGSIVLWIALYLAATACLPALGTGPETSVPLSQLGTGAPVPSRRLVVTGEHVVLRSARITSGGRRGEPDAVWSWYALVPPGSTGPAGLLFISDHDEPDPHNDSLREIARLLPGAVGGALPPRTLKQPIRGVVEPFQPTPVLRRILAHDYITLTPGAVVLNGRAAVAQVAWGRIYIAGFMAIAALGWIVGRRRVERRAR